MHADAIEMAENMYFYRVLRNVFSPGMITIVLTPPSAPEVGGLDGSGGDTVEVIPVKIRTTAPSMYPKFVSPQQNSPEHAHYCILWYAATCTILGLTFHQQYHELSHC